MYNIHIKKRIVQKNGDFTKHKAINLFTPFYTFLFTLDTFATIDHTMP